MLYLDGAGHYVCARGLTRVRTLHCFLKFSFISILLITLINLWGEKK